MPEMTITPAARYYRVHPVTLRRWANAGTHGVVVVRHEEPMLVDVPQHLIDEVEGQETSGPLSLELGRLRMAVREAHERLEAVDVATDQLEEAIARDADLRAAINESADQVIAALRLMLPGTSGGGSHRSALA